jgi:hypothetical protein
MSERKPKRNVFETAGYSDEDSLWFEPGVSRCGKILDGVALGHDGSAGWVLAFDDLKAMYEAAIAARPEKP